MHAVTVVEKQPKKRAAKAVEEAEAAAEAAVSASEGDGDGGDVESEEFGN